MSTPINDACCTGWNEDMHYQGCPRCHVTCDLCKGKLRLEESTEYQPDGSSRGYPHYHASCRAQDHVLAHYANAALFIKATTVPLPPVVLND